MKILSFFILFVSGMMLLAASIAAKDAFGESIRLVFFGIGISGITFSIMEAFSSFLENRFGFNAFRWGKTSNVAIHEAGHVMVSHLQGDLVTIETQKISDTEGRTTCLGELDLKLYSLQLMAGDAAEESVFGFSRGGSGLDMLKWHKLVNLILDKENTDFPNKRKNEIAYRQRKYLLDFFHDNMDVLLDLAKDIEKGRKLTKDELTPHFARMTHRDFRNLFPHPDLQAPRKSARALNARSVHRAGRLSAP